jgi:hypothetical protein
LAALRPLSGVHPLAGFTQEHDVDGPERALAQVPVVLPRPCRDPRVQLSAPRVFPSAESLSEFNSTDKEDPTHRAPRARLPEQVFFKMLASRVGVNFLRCNRTAAVRAFSTSAATAAQTRAQRQLEAAELFAKTSAASLTPPDSLVDSSKVFVKNDQWGGAGAYASVAVASGGVVEKGIVRVLTNVDGNENPYVFTWSDDKPCTTWAIGSGCSTFYNTGEAEVANTHMERDFEGNTFVITATKDIAAGDELVHEYKSKGWRTCFQELNE